MSDDPVTAPYVDLQVTANIANITFYHPSHNSLPSALLLRLSELIKQADADADVKVLVISSAGQRSFCAGASFDELLAITDEQQAGQFFMGFANVIIALRGCSKFVVGRVHGKAVGGGVGIAAACDYVLASERASIKLSELAIGIGPFVIGPALERKLGNSAFSQLSMDADRFYSAQWAAQRGLFHQVFADTDELDKALHEMTQRLSTYSSQAMAALREVFWQGTEHWDELLAERAKISGKLVLSVDAQRWLASFKDKLAK